VTKSKLCCTNGKVSKGVLVIKIPRDKKACNPYLALNVAVRFSYQRMASSPAFLKTQELPPAPGMEGRVRLILKIIICQMPTFLGFNCSLALAGVRVIGWRCLDAGGGTCGVDPADRMSRDERTFRSNPIVSSRLTYVLRI
jgi:hypothetical protein